MRRLLAAWALALLAAPGPREVEPKGYVCGRARGPIAIDGRPDEPAWQAAPWTEPFVDIEGDARPRPRFRTRAKMLWDDDYFYIAAQLDEPHIWGTITEHDAVIFHDNDFEVFIDPDADNHDYYEVEINALNAEWDLRLVKPYRDGGPALNEWEIPGLKTAVHVRGTLNDPTDEDEGWTVELALPWRVLAEFTRRRCPPRDGDQWRVNFSRVEWRHEVRDGRYRKLPGTKEDNWVWSPQGVVDMHQPETWGIVQFSAEPPGRAAFRPDPSLPARRVLRRIYDAQTAYRRAHGRWAGSWEDLGLDEAAGREVTSAPEIRATADGYRASVEYRDAEVGVHRLTIRQDSRVGEE